MNFVFTVGQLGQCGSEEIRCVLVVGHIIVRLNLNSVLVELYVEKA